MHVVWRRKIFLTLLVLGIAAALAWAFRPVPLWVEVAPVVKGPLRVSVLEEGRTRIKERFVVSAPVAGVLSRVALDVGDEVEKGAALGLVKPLQSEVLDPRTRAQAEAQVAAAAARLRAAEQQVKAAAAAADYAETEVRRLRKLVARGDVARDEFDRADANARQTIAQRRSAEADVERARYDLEAARTALQYSGVAPQEGQSEQVVIHAPVDGQVLKLYRESEGVVAAGQEILEIGDSRDLEVEVDVLSADAVRIPVGGRVLFERWGGDAELEGRVRVIEPAGFTKVSALGVEEQRVWVIVDFVSPRQTWERLGDGYRVEARFVLWEAEDVLQIPASSLLRQGDGWAVFRAQGDRARLHPVKPGQRDGLRAQILQGLEPGQTVVAHPPSELEDGGRIRVQGGT
jgi:HlyD family secretion protein